MIEIVKILNHLISIFINKNNYKLNKAIIKNNINNKIKIKKV